MAKETVQSMLLKDKILLAVSFLAGLFMIIALIPKLSWRWANADPNLTSRFSAARAYNLYGLTDQNLNYESWLTMRKDTCAQLEALGKQDPLSALASRASAKLGGGGAAMGCAGWPACKSHVSSRCQGYITLAWLGIFCIICFVLATVGTFATAALTFWAAHTAGAKKKDDEKVSMNLKILITAAASLKLNVVALLSWVWTSDSIFKGFQNEAYYPYPASSKGSYLAGTGTVFLAISLLLALWKYFPITLPFLSSSSSPAPSAEGAQEEQQAEEQYQQYADSAVPSVPFLSAAGMGMSTPPPVVA